MSNATPQPRPAPAPSPPPPGAAPAATPPPATAQKPVNGAAQECPLKAEIPCDLQKLTFKATIVGIDEDPEVQVRKLETTKKKRNAPVSDVKSARALELLGRYDLVIDAFAGYPSREDAFPKAMVKLEAKVDVTGHCGFQVHPAMTVKPLTTARELADHPGGLVKLTTAIDPISFHANESLLDMGQRKGVMVLFDILWSLWPMFHPKEIEVRAESCGIRPKGAGGAPNPNLVALLRIYRNDKYAVGVKIPALGSFSQESAGTVTGLSESSTERKYSAGYGLAQGSSSSKVSGDGALGNYEFSQTRIAGGHGAAYSQSREVENGSVKQVSSVQTMGAEGTKVTTEDGEHASQIMEKLKRAKGFEIFIKRNGRELAHEVMTGESKSWADKIIDGLTFAFKEIAAFRDMFLKMPQLGWKFTFDVSLLAGAIALEIGAKTSKEVKADGRYYPIEAEIIGKLEISIIELNADISFGVEAKHLGTGIVVKVGGKLSLKVPVAAEFTLDWQKPKFELTLKPEAKAGLYATATASVFGWSAVDAYADATACFDMPNGKLEVSLDHGIKLLGVVKSETIYIKGYIKGPWLGTRLIDPPIKVIDERILYTFA